MNFKIYLLSVIFLILSFTGFSEIISYISTKDGKIIENSYIDDSLLYGRYYENLKNYLNIGDKYYLFNTSNILFNSLKEVVDYKIMEKYLNDNNIFIDYDSLNDKVDLNYNRLKSNEFIFNKSVIFFNEEKNIRNYMKVKIWMELVDEKFSDFLINKKINISVENWFEKYRENFDFIVTWKPLKIEYRIDRIDKTSKLIETEQFYRNIIFEEKDVPDEWIFSYLKLNDISFENKKNTLEDLKKFKALSQSFKDGKVIEMSLINLSQVLNEKSIELENENIYNSYKEIYYYKTLYDINSMNELDERIKILEDDLNDLSNFKKRILKELYYKNKDSQIINYLYSNFSDDLDIDYLYFDYVYEVMNEYYSLYGRDENFMIKIKNSLTQLQNISSTYDEDKPKFEDLIYKFNKLID
ncbi:hypothetical protein OF820_11535 [Oceanotoga sp. DSM 15011]|uniref:hypothetical protein n=1 Tax=Oceanotoga sp. DSM 15011 TaxID=2984951 RepID=UPI0021F4EE90|nr:hypothetical protein [Oceanotoga sp. DSM 15011]UYO99677.1 hypothetical protein OF820_11535 [Oceanotoga sp. DSM 15011]